MTCRNRGGIERLVRRETEHLHEEPDGPEEATAPSMLTGTSSSGPGSWIVISESRGFLPHGRERNLCVSFWRMYPPITCTDPALEPLGGGELGILDALPVGPQNDARDVGLRRPD